VFEAKSIYLGGAIVAASGCGYHSSIELGLNCPFCNRPVFLVQGFSRKRGDKSHAVPTHFSHYKADSEAGKDCEARSLSKEGREFIRKLSPEARGQRLAIYNRRLWKMITWEKELAHWSGSLPNFQKYSDHIHGEWPKHPREEIRALMREMAAEVTVEALTARPTLKSPDGGSISPEVAEGMVQVMTEGLDTKMQWEICMEVFDYLHTNEARPVFDSLIRMNMIDAIDVAIAEGWDIKAGGVKTSMVHRFALATIALVRWEDALAKFAKPQPGDGFGRKR
jgi:hypothetical protein